MPAHRKQDGKCPPGYYPVGERTCLKGGRTPRRLSPKSPSKERPTTLVPTRPTIRPGLVVRQTLLTKGKQRMPFWGLFTTLPIPSHAFLGVYHGDFFLNDGLEEEEETRSQVLESHYALDVGDVVIVPPSIRPKHHPMGMLNEPPRGRQANVSVVVWTAPSEALPEFAGRSGKGKVLLATMYTCREVEAGEELYYHYGDAYDRRHYGRRPYNVGTPCLNLGKNKIHDSEKPGPFLRNLHGPHFRLTEESDYVWMGG